MHMFLFPKFAAYSFQHFASPLMLYFIRISYVYVSSLAFLLLLISSPISGLVLSISIHYPLIFPGCQLNFGCSTFIKRSVSPEILIDCPSFFFALYHKIPKVSIFEIIRAVTPLQQSLSCMELKVFWFSTTSPCSPGKVTGPLNVVFYVLFMASPLKWRTNYNSFFSTTIKLAFDMGLMTFRRP